MTPQDRWTLLQNIMQDLGLHYGEAITPIFTEFGFQGGDWAACFWAYALDPQPLTAVAFNNLYPYSNITVHQERLALTAEHGFLETIGDDGYRLTKKGRQGMDTFFQLATTVLADVYPLPPNELNWIADLLGRVITATEQAEKPATKTQFNLSRVTDPGQDAPPLTRIDQYVTDLLRYRDDAHIAAWQVYGISAPAWEAFTFLWRGDADNADTLVEKLPFRSHDTATYTAALQEIVAKGWAEPNNGGYKVTKMGQTLREEAESRTDKYFYTGWSAITEEETAELDDLLQQLRQSLRDLAGDNATASRDDLWPLAGTISGHLFIVTREAVTPVLEASNLAERGMAYALIQGAYMDPDYVSGARVVERFPYGTAVNWDKRFADLAEKGYLVPDGDNTYYLNDNGRQKLNHFLTTFRGRLTELTADLDVDVDRLAELLARLINACLNTTNPPGSIHLARSHNLYPGDDASSLARIDQYLDDLNAFRDDSHLATFHNLAIEGHTWELFTALWREDVGNAAEAVEKFGKFRGHDEAAYQAGLDDLMARGWVNDDGNGRYTLTDTGITIRENAEIQTNRYFYLPWLALNNADTEELRQLMTQLEAALNALATEAQPA